MPAACYSIKDSVDGMLGLIDNATKQSSGKFLNVVRKSGNLWDLLAFHGKGTHMDVAQAYVHSSYCLVMYTMYRVVL